MKCQAERDLRGHLVPPVDEDMEAWERRITSSMSHHELVAEKR